jgi:hypothetical protein
MSASAMALVLSILGCDFSLNGDPCSCYDLGGSPNLQNTSSSCDGNVLVTSSAPECGPGCNTPSITRLDCGASVCAATPNLFDEEGEYDAACIVRCATSTDCGANQSCGVVYTTAGDARGCVPALPEGQPCTTDPGAPPCADGLACLPVLDASVADAGGDALSDAGSDAVAPDSGSADANVVGSGTEPTTCQPVP